SPLPLSTTTPTDRSQRASRNASVSSATVFVRKALRTSGRLIVIQATPSFFSYRMSVDVMSRDFTLERLLQQPAQLADDEDGALHDGQPGADLGQVVLERDHEEGADHRSEDRPHPAEQRHEHD